MTETSSRGMFGRLVGARIKRSEDPRLLTGQGRYTDDLRIAGTLHAAFLRSPFAHARITSIDTSEAAKLRGVIAILTAQDLSAPLKSIRVPMDGLADTPYPALCSDRVRLVGDLVAMVVAESRYIAEDALDLIEVDYDPLPAVCDIPAALETEAVALFDDVGTNLVFSDQFSNGDVDAAFSSADKVVSHTFVQHRLTHVPMETRGCLAEPTPSSRRLTFHSGNQSADSMRNTLAQFLELDPSDVRVQTPDVGGAFGMKYYTFREDLLVAWASMRLGRPIKWIEDRRENLTASGQAREETLECSLAVTSDGRILGMKVRCTMDIGAYPLPPFSGAVMPGIIRQMMPGPYKFEAFSFESRAVITNKAPYLAYRGPWAAETWVRESIIDLAAREIGMEPSELRRRNILTYDDQPYVVASGMKVAHLSAHLTLERALELADLPAFRQRQAAAREKGRLLGFGLSTFIEAAPGDTQSAGRRELAHVRMDAGGHVTVFTAQTPHGQGHETTLAQIVASELGVPFEHVKVLWGDTQAAPIPLTGTGGSQAATFASGAAKYAALEVRTKLLEVASHLLEASPEDLELEDARVAVKGVPSKALPVAQIAAAVYRAPQLLPAGSPSGLEATYAFDGGAGGYAQATHCCWVDVDPETGKVDIPRYLIVEDCGTMINPNIVEGQVRGGTVQGIGQMLLEEVVYDSDGQLLTSTFMDYLVPTATEVPYIEIEHLQTPPTDAVNFRGVGEGGTVCAPPAVTNAISDALGGVPVTRTPVTPERVLRLSGKLP